MTMRQRIAARFGPVICNGQAGSATPPQEMLIGGMKISRSGMQSAHTPAGVPSEVMVPGMSPEINPPRPSCITMTSSSDYANQ